MAKENLYVRLRLYAIGLCVQEKRDERRLSVEDIVKSSEVSHVTWRRVEDGKVVRSATYAAFDRFFKLPPGTFQRATANDDDCVLLAREMGVDTAPVDKKLMTPAEFVEYLAMSHRLGAVEFGGLQAPSDLVLPTQSGAPSAELRIERPAVTYQPEPGLPRPSGAERVLVQAIGPDGERTYLPVTGEAARRFELVTLLRTDLGRDKNRDGFAEEVLQILAKFSDHILSPYLDEAFGRRGNAGD